MPHQRRDGYWPDYHDAHASKKDFVVGHVKDLVRKNPPPEPARGGGRGRSPVYPRTEMAIACILMAAFNITCRDAETEVPSWRLDMDGLVPDHTTIWRAYGALDKEWLEGTLARVASECLEESGIDRGAMAADSSGIETDRYADATVLDKKTLKEEAVRVKSYLKWHVLAVIGLQVILSCRTTPSNVNDTNVLPYLLDKAGKLGRSFDGWMFNADKGYDSDSNCRAVIGMGMHPNIKQRRSAENSGNRRNVGRPFRRRAGEMFDPDGYKRRGMVEGIFGAEEAAGHRLRCRYRKESTRERFGTVLAIAWNVCALNRIRCTVENGRMPTMA